MVKSVVSITKQPFSTEIDLYSEDSENEDMEKNIDEFGKGELENLKEQKYFNVGN